MRTDVKVGLVCAFAIILGLVIYFVAQGNRNPRPAQGNTPSTQPVDPGPQVTTTRPADPPVATPGTPLALAGGGGIGGPLISPPSTAPATEPAAVTTFTPMPGGTPVGTPTTDGGPAAPAAGTTPGATPPVATGGPGAGLGGLATPPLGSTPPTGAAGGGIDTTPRSLDLPPAGGFGAAGGLGRGLGAAGAGLGGLPRTEPSPMFPGGGVTTYKIQRGDMLGPIARRFGVTVRAIEAANPGIDSTRLQINQVIRIPAASTSATPPTSPSATPATTRVAAAAAPVRPASGIRPGSSYTVKKGDTLSTIAATAYGDKNQWQRIFRANRGTISDPNTIPVGAVLRIPQ